MSIHSCHAAGCRRTCPPKMLMCASCWRQVPRDNQDAVWATYRRGQERTMTPSIDYLYAAAAAVEAQAAVTGATQEQIEEATCGYYAWAQMLEQV